MKWVDEDDDIPLAKLKKSRYEDPVFIDSLSQLELAAYSLTQLQHAAPSVGPVQEFMKQPLHRFQGQLSGFLPHPMAFAPETSSTISQVDSPPTINTGTGPPSPASMAVYSSNIRRHSRSPRGRRRAPAAMVVSQPSSHSQVNP
jgi:hypothetical protein